MNKNTNAVILYGSFLVVNLILLSLGQINFDLFFFVVFISSYYLTNIDSFDYKNVKAYIYPVIMLLIYITVAIKVSS